MPLNMAFQFFRQVRFRGGNIMKVLHSYCLNYNIGDYALGIGVKNLLRQYFNIELIAETNLQGRTFDEYYITNVVNKLYNLLLIGGGGIIHGAHWPQGWFWLIEKVTATHGNRYQYSDQYYSIDI